MNPRKRIRYVEEESFNKPKIYYQKSHPEEETSAPIQLNLDEYEALRLYHYKNLPQSECARSLNISQPTFSRILHSGIDKLVRALVEEADFEILGGNILYKEWIGWGCWVCDHQWLAEKSPASCPKCGENHVYSLKKLVSYFSE